jgi:hypothetical protein
MTANTAANASPSSSSNYSSGFGGGGGGLSGNDQQNSRSNSPSQFSNASSLSSSSQSFFGQFKQEPTNSSLDNNNVIIKSELMATFSSDDDDEDDFKETNAASNFKLSLQLQQQIQTSTNSLMPPTMTTTTTKSPSPSASFLQLQSQLNQFLNSGDMRRPFKLFTSVDDVTTINETTNTASLANNNNNNNNNLDTHIHLIASDYLRDKLFELNDKIKSTKTSSHYQQVNAAFKDILTYIHRDVDTLNNFSSTLTDLTISLCIILKNDFSNCMLPSSFYGNVVKTNFNNNTQQKNGQQQQGLSKTTKYSIIIPVSQNVSVA